MDRLLSIGEVEAYFKHLGAMGGFDRLEAMNIISQLTDTMRENERLREALQKIADTSECHYADVVARKALELPPYKESDNG